MQLAWNNWVLVYAWLFVNILCSLLFFLLLFHYNLFLFYPPMAHSLPKQTDFRLLFNVSTAWWMTRKYVCVRRLTLPLMAMFFSLYHNFSHHTKVSCSSRLICSRLSVSGDNWKVSGRRAGSGREKACVFQRSSALTESLEQAIPYSCRLKVEY